MNVPNKAALNKINLHNFTFFASVLDLSLHVSLRRVLDIHCQNDSSRCLAQLTPARVGKARSVHVQLGASPHVIR